MRPTVVFSPVMASVVSGALIAPVALTSVSALAGLAESGPSEGGARLWA